MNDVGSEISPVATFGLRTFVAGQGSRRGATGRWNEKWAQVVEGQMAFYGSEMDKTNDMPQILLSVEQIECVYIDEVQLTMKGNKPPITLESVRDEYAPSPLLILELEMDLRNWPRLKCRNGENTKLTNAVKCDLFSGVFVRQRWHAIENFDEF